MNKDLPYPLNYRLTVQLVHGQWEHRYVVEGALGAVEFWVREWGDAVAQIMQEREPDRRFSAGFETHTATPKIGAGAPDHGFCSALSWRACWHDGSSLYGMEHWLPIWLRNREDRIGIFRLLAGEYAQRFEAKEATDGQ